MSIESVSKSSPPNRAPTFTRQPSREAEAQRSGESLTENRVSEIAELARQAPQKSDVQDAVKRLNDFVAPSQSEISFSIDEDSGVRVVKILDSQSKEVIRQIPSEEAVELARALDKLQGLLIKDKA